MEWTEGEGNSHGTTRVIRDCQETRAQACLVIREHRKDHGCASGRAPSRLWPDLKVFEVKPTGTKEGSIVIQGLHDQHRPPVEGFLLSATR